MGIDIRTYSFNLLGGKGLKASLGDESMTLKQRSLTLTIPYEQIIEEVGYGFGHLCGVAVIMSIAKRTRCLHMYEAGGHSVLDAFHEDLSSRLDSYRSHTDLAVSGIPLRFTCLALVSSWRKSAYNKTEKRR